MSSTSPSRIRDKQKVFIKCKMCGNTIMISYATYHRHGGDAFNWRCKKCIMNNLSDEEKDDWIDECLKRFKCRRYVFVVDKTEKYKDFVVDNIRINCRSSVYYEYLIIIDNIGGNKGNAREI